MSKKNGDSVGPTAGQKLGAGGAALKRKEKKSSLSRKKLFKEFRDYLDHLDKDYAKDLEKADERDRKEDWLSMEPRSIAFPNSWNLPGDLPGGFVCTSRDPEVMKVEVREDRTKLLKKKERKKVQEYLDALNKKLAKRQARYEQEEDTAWDKKEKKALKKIKKREAQKEQKKLWEQKEEEERKERRRKIQEEQAKHQDSIRARVDQSLAKDGVGRAIKNIRKESDETAESIRDALSYGRSNVTPEEEKYYGYIEATLNRTWKDKLESETAGIENLEELMERTRNPLYRLRIKQHLEVMRFRQKRYKRK